MAWLSVAREPPDTAHSFVPAASMSVSATTRSSMSVPVSAQTWVFGSSMKMPSRFVAGPKSAPHHRPSAYQSLDCAVLVVGDRTTVASTAKSGKVIPIGGATEPPPGPVVADADGTPLAGGRDGEGDGDGDGGFASAITATIDPAMTSTNAPSATQGRSIPFVAAPSPSRRGGGSQT